MKIGNIIFENELVNHTQVDYINYIKEPLSYTKNDNRFPTLYVGWLFMKKCNQNNSLFNDIDILNNEINPNKLYWEYSFDENKSSHVKGVENFVNLVPQYYYSNYEYEVLDPVFYQIKTIDDFVKNLPLKIDGMYNYNNEMIYLLVDDKIFGIDLKMYEFLKIKPDDITSILLNKVETTNTYLDYDISIYQKFYKIFPNFSQLKRYIISMLIK